MNDIDDKTTLPLPKRRSPKSLDDKILNYAHGHAPSGESSGSNKSRWTTPPLWLTGMATASLAVVAVLITQQPQPPGQLIEASPSIFSEARESTAQNILHTTATIKAAPNMGAVTNPDESADAGANDGAGTGANNGANTGADKKNCYGCRNKGICRCRAG